MYSTVAGVVFFGLCIALSVSSRGSGTLATPIWTASRPPAADGGRPGEQAEERRLAGLGKPEQSDAHSVLQKALDGSIRPSDGAWRSPVARLLWEQVVGGSNPSAPTNFLEVGSTSKL